MCPIPKTNPLLKTLLNITYHLYYNIHQYQEIFFYVDLCLIINKKIRGISRKYIFDIKLIFFLAITFDLLKHLSQISGWPSIVPTLYVYASTLYTFYVVTSRWVFSSLSLPLSTISMKMK
ncbi:MAG: hypothetical protein Ct9H90mP18_00730 [Gammaproteobacteria bacterium]|nr:MAG: hypothetical protein Ct9H90mP18_00730 [Gammaproteobacteria bacterium]